MSVAAADFAIPAAPFPFCRYLYRDRGKKQCPRAAIIVLMRRLQKERVPGLQKP